MELSHFDRLIAELQLQLNGLLQTDIEFNSPLVLRLQTFIAFAYFYHYLNWFSKTSIIGWSKGLNLSSSIVIAILWMASLVMYSIDLEKGFAALFFLSLLHVFLEFPLNLISIRGLIAPLKKN